MDWFPAVMALVGVLVGLGVQEFRNRRGKKDKYKDMVFMKRLEVHQEAYYLCTKLSHSVAPDKLVRDGAVDAAMKEIWGAVEWLEKNTLYLDIFSMDKMSRLLFYMIERSPKYRDEEWRKNLNIEEEKLKIGKDISGVLYSLEKGIGVDYLPERELLFKLEMNRIADELLEKAEEVIRKSKEIENA